ncbi:MAG: glycoside hydrolase family 31 protein, partial [Clostridia bacterium]|nr:glycoside hydrolase family 31 protein [Clostridia bacterium]
RNAAGIYCRLTYDGYNGWRLQANASSYDGFDDTGAAQALGLYLGEDPKDTAERLTIVDDGGVLKVTAANHDTYVTIDYTDSFQMRFYSATGALMSNVSDVSFTGATSSEASDEFFTIKGNLLDGEAVYGGGERFDVVNKRGTSFVLYTSDGWNSTATTYVAVPLFVTSRGAGIFMNRYERIVADFGAASSDEWVLTLDNDLMDCYFYATGAMSDALLGYTELSGHSGLPEEWAQGEMICRYSPDLATFEDRSEYRTNYTSYTQIPNYTSYYVQGTNGSSTIRSAIGSEYSNYTYDYTILYESPATSSPNVIYYLNEETGTYDKTGAKGNPAGDGVKTIVTNLINAGMKPHSMLMEPWGWSSVSSNAEKAADLKETVEWLENLGIKTMLYMGVASISSNMSGYKSEYQVWANLTYEDGTIDRIYKLPRTSGNGTNPDVGTSSTQQFLDITNPEAVDWYMNFIWDQLIDIGIDGIKIDFCETMPNEGWLYDQSTGQNFYFEYDWYDDSVFEDDDVHHAYSTYFISLFYNNMNKMKAEKGIPDGFVVLSRGGGIGSQRNPYLWEGDQVRSFEKIEDQLIALINTGISGIPFMTYDMAGYAYSSRSGSFTMSVETESAIFARAIEYTAFTSNIQTHGDVRHAYQMTEETQEIYREFCDLHEELLPYIQKYSKVACDTGMPVVRHMVLQYQDDANVYDLETQYMFGDAILVAPIVSANQTSKDVYLPAGSWLNLLTGETVAGGQTVTVSADLGQIPVFMNTDCSAEDRALLATVFNGETWQAISGVTLNIETVAD